jgi:hypothetical protein
LLQQNRVARDRGAIQLHKQLTKPTHLYHAISHNMVLRLSARTGDDVLTLRGPGNKVVVEEHRVAQNGPVSAKTTSPVSISVYDEA